MVDYPRFAYLIRLVLMSFTGIGFLFVIAFIKVQISLSVLGVGKIELVVDALARRNGS